MKQKDIYIMKTSLHISWKEKNVKSVKNNRRVYNDNSRMDYLYNDNMFLYFFSRNRIDTNGYIN